MKYHLALFAALALSSAAFGENIDKVNGGIHVTAGQNIGKASTVNGSIDVDNGATVESAHTVNGHIEIGDNATAGQLETVNGGITLGSRASAEELTTVNGEISLGSQAAIKGSISSVNAHMKADDGASIHGDVVNVNGSMNLRATNVGGRLETVNGDINIGENSRVDGGILVKKPTMSWFNTSNKVPRIVIGPGATVNGTLKFEHEVDLFVSDRATVGKIEGATAKKFSGAKP
jgi:DUF4097 and DUF4098 domain-containing protein YvlB